MKNDTIKITIIKPTFLAGKSLLAGSNETLPTKQARDLINAGKAKLSSDLTEADKKYIKQIKENAKYKDQIKGEMDHSQIAKIHADEDEGVKN